ncbi:MAG: 30S ribosomal protein S12 methylthiotransferase RimO [Bacteroidota bacterium]|nr:30S ribosomal protein S12 methylthiotransferase RimO [Bacteroidota bacterium]
MKKIDIINLGCSKNLVDAEFLYTQLKANGIEVRLNPETTDANTLIINTCGFIGDAKEESINAILEAVDLKKQSHNSHLVVMGCLSQRYKTELKNEIPEVDALYGVNEIPAIVRDLGYQYFHDKLLHRLHSTSDHYAYLKIAEGCDRNCAFCAIPMIRGKQISKSVDKLVEEAKYLSDHGVKELILISQELTRYGIDIYKRPELVKLLDELQKINGIEWIRLHYTYPNLFGDDLIDIMAGSSIICHYLDIPFQHFNDKVLTMMKRGHSKADGLELIQKIRSKIPDIALRTTMLVGHPGEDEKAFNELYDAVQEIRFDRLGVFTYSHEEGTHSFKNYEDSIPPVTKRERADKLMKLQQSLSLDYNENRVGTVLKVLIDKHEGEYFVGRTQYDSPEIDNEVLIKDKDNNIKVGSFFDVKITDATEFDLYGTNSY